MDIRFDDIKYKLTGMEKDITDLYDAMNIKNAEKQASELDKQAAAADFWDDQENSQKVLKKLKHLKDSIEAYNKLKTLYEDTLTLIDMAKELDDDSQIDEVEENYKKICEDLESQRLKTLLKGEYDTFNAIMTFHSGAGGTEAQDWAQMLYRMYTRWAERKGFKYSVIDYLDGDEAGIKSASLLIEGEYAYGFLKSEMGVHRLVRISPFDASGRRHTSFASIEIMPEFNDEIEIEIKDEDLRIDTYRSGGAGGQHINKTDSAVRITHLPTGIVAACQNERSQHQNKEMAMKMLKSKLLEIKEREQLEKIEDIKGVQKEIAWGSQIRSYVFMPYTLVKDHRTSFENGNVTAVMDGDLDGFINAYLKSQVKNDI